MKLFYFDVETTGLSASKHAIHQLSFIIEVDGEEKKRYNYNIRPFEGAEINEDALKISNVTKEQINNNELSYKEAFNKLKTVLSYYVDKFNKKDKFFLVGYNNASFDNHFLRALFLQNGDNYFGSFFWSSPIDVFILASFARMKERSEMPSFKLKDTAISFGIEVEESRLHDAIYDVELTREIFKKL